ncbi:adenyl-nucleotide exchange factor sse1 [Boothiomyces macroporosus]|uniref:Adenyl-nucleotide exchange factor sse1 n=1 Tax=Boothiomyces macroporosus TaxID=261099 RepID=A0AAD5Y3P8_9FUNG|nr:adenyl-nucleotide exchange factor sse1 [Boothiomyces macroporosus]
MSVVGIDLGNLNTVVAVARNRGIDVITNETSNRATPSLVSFTDKQRFLGEGAKTLEISNFKHTVASLKRLAGRHYDDPEIIEKELRFINARVVKGDREEAAVAVNYLNEEKVFSFTQLNAMFLAKVKEFTGKELGIPVSDCVISCPTWFTDSQRRALLDAANVAGLNCLRLMNDTTASALGYGITKTDLPDPDVSKVKPRIVTFVDIGHSSCQVGVVSFVKGKLTILGVACDRNLGGRDFDQVIVDHYTKEFNAKYKMDIGSNAKATFRLRQGAEKVKKVLSANAQAPFNIECLLDDKDVSALVHRADFEEMSQEMVQRILVPIQQALDAAKVSAKDVDFVELIGGTTRIPMVKDAIAKFFGGSLDGENKLATTMNQDEAVARGCALQCAVLSPVFKVRDFTVQDINTHPIELTWDVNQMPDPKKGEKHVTSFEAFGAHSPVPSAKALSLVRALRKKELGTTGTVSMNIKAAYTSEAVLPTGTKAHIGEWVIGGIQKLESCVVKEGDREVSSKANIKVKAKLDGNGLISIESADQTEEVVVPVEEAPAAEGEEKEKDAKDAKAKTKKIIKRYPLTIAASTHGASSELIDAWRSAEGEMAASDRLVVDTAEKRNALEEYVYETRSKLSDQWAEFALEADRESFTKILYDVEDWLYGEGEDASKSVYVEKLVEIKKIGNPIAHRYMQNEERPYAEKELREYINSVLLDIQAEDDRYSHIGKDELQKINDEANKKLQWINEKISKQNETPKHKEPVVTVEKIKQEQNALRAFATAILSKPKPKPVVEEKKEEPKAKEGAEETTDVPMEGEDAPPLEPVEEKENMDLD